MYQSRIGIHNSSQLPRIVYIEPWADDYTLMPDEELVLEAHGVNAVPWFNIVEWANDTQIYCENTQSFVVTQKGVPIACGHQRQPGSSASMPTQS